MAAEMPCPPITDMSVSNNAMSVNELNVSLGKIPLCAPSRRAQGRKHKKIKQTKCVYVILVNKKLRALSQRTEETFRLNR